MSDPETLTVLSFDIDGLCDPETGVCAYPPAAAYASEESDSSESNRTDGA